MLIDVFYFQNLAPYWPLCERLSSMTRDLLVTHSQMYQPQPQQHPSSSIEENTTSKSSLLKPPPPPPSVLPVITPDDNDNASRSFIVSPCGTISTIDPTATTATATTPTAIPPSAGGYLPSFNVSSSTSQLQAPPQQPSSMPIKGGDLNNLLIPGVINFDSLDFLYDTELYGQLMFDDRPSSAASSPAHHNNNIPSYFTMTQQGPTATAFNPSSSSQRPTIQQRRGATMLYGLQAARQPPVMQ